MAPLAKPTKGETRHPALSSVAAAVPTFHTLFPASPLLRQGGIFWEVWKHAATLRAGCHGRVCGVVQIGKANLWQVTEGVGAIFATRRQAMLAAEEWYECLLAWKAHEQLSGGRA